MRMSHLDIAPVFVRESADYQPKFSSWVRKSDPLKISKFIPDGNDFPNIYDCNNSDYMFVSKQEFYWPERTNDPASRKIAAF